MIYPLAHDSWDHQEKDALLKVIQSGRYTMGPEVAEFKLEFAKYFKSKYAVMTNSGSSANLLMLSTLRYDNRFNLQADTIAEYVDNSGFFISNDGRDLSDNLQLVRHTLDQVYQTYKL